MEVQARSRSVDLTRFLWVGGEKLQNSTGCDTRTWLGPELHVLTVRA